MTLQYVTVIKNVFLSGEYTTDLALHSLLLESGQMAAEPDIPSFFIPCTPSSSPKHGRLHYPYCNRSVGHSLQDVSQTPGPPGATKSCFNIFFTYEEILPNTWKHTMMCEIEMKCITFLASSVHLLNGFLSFRNKALLHKCTQT